MMPAQTPNAAGSSDKVPPQSNFTSALCLQQSVELEGSVSTFDNPNTAVEKKMLVSGVVGYRRIALFSTMMMTQTKAIFDR